MKNKCASLYYLLLFIGIFLMFTNSCKKKDDTELIPTTVTDIDGNVYNTIIIGTQVWMKENLIT